MGKRLSKSSTRESVSLDFEPEQSYVVAIGIDNSRQLPWLCYVKEDVEELCKTFAQKDIALPVEKIKQYISSNDEPHCTAMGIRDAISAAKSAVGKKGLLVLYYAGHAGFPKEERGLFKWNRAQPITLAPYDFDSAKRDTHLTGRHLRTLLDGVKCAGVLVILDMCYAEGVFDDGRDIPTDDRSDSDEGIYIISACSCDQISHSVSTLGHSFFTFFLIHAIKQKMTMPTNKFPIQDIFDECAKCCEAITSLVCIFEQTKNGKITVDDGRMTPTFRRQSTQSRGQSPKDSPVSKDEENPCDLVEKYFSTERDQRPKLRTEFVAWLNFRTIDSKSTPLKPLLDRKMLTAPSKVWYTVIYQTMRTAALYQLKKDKNDAYNPDMFLVTFIFAIKRIFTVKQTSMRDVTHEDLQRGLESYITILEKCNSLPSDMDRLKQLQRHLQK